LRGGTCLASLSVIPLAGMQGIQGMKKRPVLAMMNADERGYKFVIMALPQVNVRRNKTSPTKGDL